MGMGQPFMTNMGGMGGMMPPPNMGLGMPPVGMMTNPMGHSMMGGGLGMGAGMPGFPGTGGMGFGGAPTISSNGFGGPT